MLTLPIVLLAALLAVFVVAKSKRKKGAIAESSYATLVAILAVLVTGTALVVLFLRLRM